MKHMLAIITTKYSGPTGSTGSRINATLHLARDGSTVRARSPWNHGLGIEANHKQAAFAALGKAGLIRGDYTLDGWSHDGVGHWSAIDVQAAGITLTQAEAADHLEIIEQVAGYALEGWADALDRPDFDAWAKRYDDARHRLGATGNTTWFAE